MKFVVQDLTSGGIDWQREKWQSGLGSKFIHQGEKNAVKYSILIEQLSRLEHVSEKLKEENQMEWVRRMKNLENRAAEIVKAELIYTFEGR